MADDLRLKVVASSIDGKGIAKLDRDTFEKMKLSEGSIIIVTYGAKSMELAAKMDNVFSAATTRLMKADMTVLRVEEGMLVTITKKNGNTSASQPTKAKKGKKNAKANAASLDSF